MVHSPDKTRRLRAMALGVEIEVDGGIDAQTAPLVVRAGATVLVAGSRVFGHKAGIAAGIAAIRKAVEQTPIPPPSTWGGRRAAPGGVELSNQETLKRAAAEKALELVQDGMLLGLGSG